MRAIKISKYKLIRYLRSSSPVLPVIVLCFFSGSMYSVKPVSVCSSFVVSGVLLFLVSAFVAMSIGNRENQVEEQILFLRADRASIYFLGRELSLLVITVVMALFLGLMPVLQDVLNHFEMFTRPLTAYDVGCGLLILLGEGILGIAIGDFLHPRVLEDRKLATLITVSVLVLSVCSESIAEYMPALRFLTALLPPVIQPAVFAGNTDYFSFGRVLLFLLWSASYALIVTALKLRLFYKKKF